VTAAACVSPDVSTEADWQQRALAVMARVTAACDELDGAALGLGRVVDSLPADGGAL
jgi:hypothetical protein